ncbi:MAG TPA: hypothetical protein GX706_00580 [Candidatus Moranbacteria bacterium]|nr:hypothetical protein [Candidatus Moranbacteria bacterium]
MTTQNILLHYSPQRRNLLPVIKEVSREEGFVSETAADLIAKYFNLTRAEVLSAATFYSEVKTKKQPELIIKVCDGANCNLKGSEETLRQIELFLGQKEGDEHNALVKIERVSCFGQCLSGPNVQIGETIYDKIFPDRVIDLLRGYLE